MRVRNQTNKILVWFMTSLLTVIIGLSGVIGFCVNAEGVSVLEVIPMAECSGTSSNSGNDQPTNDLDLYSQLGYYANNNVNCYFTLIVPYNFVVSSNSMDEVDTNGYVLHDLKASGLSMESIVRLSGFRNKSLAFAQGSTLRPSSVVLLI